MRVLCLLLLAMAGCQFHQAKDTASLSGVVTSTDGPEAGVWVIAETADLPTRFARIVVTDDRGRYEILDLPRARYDVWVRGYGLVDSPKVQAEPGGTLDLKAVLAPSTKYVAAAIRVIRHSISIFDRCVSMELRHRSADAAETAAQRAAHSLAQAAGSWRLARAARRD